MSIFYSEPYKYVEEKSNKRALPIASEKVLNSHLLKELNLKNGWEYRQYITKNAKEIIKCNCSHAYEEFGYLPSETPLQSSPRLTDLKELYLNKYNIESRMVAPEINIQNILENGRTH
jgi:hypothetical protein